MSSKIRVLHILPWLISGGVEKRRAVLAESLPEAEFEQKVVCMEAEGPIPEKIRAAGVPVHVVRGTWSPSDLRSMRAIRRIADDYRPDIIHGAVYEGVIMASAASLGRDARFLAEEIDYPITRSARGHWLFRRLTARAEAVVCVSPAVAEFMHEVAGMQREKLRVLLNAVPEPELPPPEERDAIRRELGLPEGALVVGSMGRMNDAHKRFSVLMRGVASLADARQELRLLLVGDGEDLDELRALARDLGIEDRVCFTGFRADIGRLLSAMDVFALVSNRESFGLVIAEAMYASLPVVCTGIGGMKDVIAEGETALVADLDDVASQAAALEALLSDPGLRRKLGDAGRRRAVERFSTGRYADEVASLYRSLARR